MAKSHAYHQRQDRRESNGRYKKMHECEGCAKPIGANYCSDPRQSGALGSYGLILCGKCSRLLDTLPDAEALEYLIHQRGKKGTP